jgi:hypothetical protein
VRDARQPPVAWLIINTLAVKVPDLRSQALLQAHPVALLRSCKIASVNCQWSSACSCNRTDLGGSWIQGNARCAPSMHSWARRDPPSPPDASSGLFM